MMINALFVVWREAFEAVLIVGILYAYLHRQPHPKRSLKFMWSGVFAGFVLSCMLAYAIQEAQTELEGRALEYFEAGMLAVAAVLMTHMCIWMKKNSRKIKGELEGELKDALTTSHLIGIAGLATLAVAREGMELVMFFFGMGVEAAERGMMNQLLMYSGAGVALTAVTAWAFYKGMKVFNPKLFFQVTGIFLLITASSLVLQTTRKLLQMDAIPPLKDQIWDTSWLIDERTSFGQVFNTITGYESSPALVTVIAFAFYWVVTLFFYLDWGKKTASAEIKKTSLA